MNQPLFSILVPTKNRADLARLAVVSILRQSFSDFEIVVSDNDDVDSTSEAILSLKDSRIRYYRSGGDLSIVDNWEKCFSLARGEYILSLTDRAAFKSCALERVADAIDSFAEDVYVWPYVTHNDTGPADTLNIPERKPAVVWQSDRIFALFKHNAYPGYTDLLPKSLNSCHSRKLVDRIRATTGGRVCLPLCPDHNIGLLTLAHCPRVVALNDPLFVWGALARSSGCGTYRRTETFNRFLKDLGMTEEDCFSQVPIKTIGVHNMVCNDFLTLKAAYPNLFESFDLDWPYYFANCHDEPALWLSPDEVLFTEKMSRIKTALELQPVRVRSQVNSILRKRSKEKRRKENNGPIRRFRERGARLLRKLHSVASTSSPIAALRETPEDPALRPGKFCDILEAVQWVEREDSQYPKRNRRLLEQTVSRT